MKINLNKVLARATLFLIISSEQYVQPVPNFEDLYGFESITNIPNHSNPYAGMALLHMIPQYLSALDCQRTPATKHLLNKLFLCPEPELEPSYIIPRTGSFQVARYLSPHFIGSMIATIDFFNQNNEWHAMTLEDKNKALFEFEVTLINMLKNETPESSEFIKKNKLFVKSLIQSMQESGLLNADPAASPLIPYFTPTVLLAFVCLRASSRSDLQDYCKAYQIRKNELYQTEHEIQDPVTDPNKSQKRNPLMAWRAGKMTTDQTLFMQSLVTFLKSTHNEMVKLIKIPDIRTRGTCYPVCIETLLYNLALFTLKSSTFSDQAENITPLLKTPAQNNLEQLIIDLSELINNLPGVVYGQLITQDGRVLNRHDKKMYINEEKIDGFVNFGQKPDTDIIAKFFSKNEENITFISENDGVMFISLGNRILGVYDPSTAYGLALRANLNNVIIGLTHLLGIQLVSDKEQRFCNRNYAKQVFDELASLLEWKTSTLYAENNYKDLHISATNNLGSLMINLSDVHGYCVCVTNKSRLHGKANALSRELLVAYFKEQNLSSQEKFLSLFTSLAPWNLFSLIKTDAINQESMPGINLADSTQIPQGFIRHIFLGQEMDNYNCLLSVAHLLLQPEGDRFIDVINFLLKKITSNVDINQKKPLSSALKQSPWINQQPKLLAKIEALIA